MKSIKINTKLLLLGPDPSPLALAEHLGAYLFHKTQGAVVGRWDDSREQGIWFYSTDPRAPIDKAPVDDVIFVEPKRDRFRSVVFRQGSLASETGADHSGVLRLFPEDPSVDPGPRRRYVVHSSYWPHDGLWLRATIVPDTETPPTHESPRASRRVSMC